MSPPFPGTIRASSGHREEEIKSGVPPSSRELLRSPKQNPDKTLPGNQNQILQPPFEKQGVIRPTLAASPAVYLTGSKAGATAGPEAGLPPGVGVGDEAGSGARGENHTENRKTGSCCSPSRGITGGLAPHEQTRDSGRVEDGRLGSTVIRETKTSQSTELPQRTTVRRAMSDCSHLSVPTIMGGAYPTGIVGSSLIPNMPDFALVGTACPPRAPYPHVAVRRSLTVTEGTDTAAAMATMMSPALMTSPVLPSSPPPKRHHGSCETNLLLPVPPPVGASVNSTQDSKLNFDGKSIVLCVLCVGFYARKNKR